jgi:Ras family protein A
MDHFLFNTPRLLVGTKSDLRNNNKRIAELSTNGQQLISIEQVYSNVDTKINQDYTLNLLLLLLLLL